MSSPIRWATAGEAEAGLAFGESEDFAAADDGGGEVDPEVGHIGGDAGGDEAAVSSLADGDGDEEAEVTLGDDAGGVDGGEVAGGVTRPVTQRERAQHAAAAEQEGGADAQRRRGVLAGGEGVADEAVVGEVGVEDLEVARQGPVRPRVVAADQLAEAEEAAVLVAGDRSGRVDQQQAGAHCGGLNGASSGGSSRTSCGLCTTGTPSSAKA